MNVPFSDTSHAGPLRCCCYYIDAHALIERSFEGFFAMQLYQQTRPHNMRLYGRRLRQAAPAFLALSTGIILS